MSELIIRGGPFMYPLVLIAVVVAVLSVWVALRVRRTAAPGSEYSSRTEIHLDLRPR